MAELLLELLSEEIPARMQARAAADLKRLVTEGLKAARLDFDSARAFATPRRLALVVDGLASRQPDLKQERRGPRADAPASAIQGFLGSVGLSLEDCEQRQTKKGIFLFASIEKPGQPTAELLANLIPDMVAALEWPKSMRWADATLRYVRPLHRILCVFDGAPVAGRLPLGDDRCLDFSNQARGHRFLGPESFEVTDFAEYENTLRAAYVILDPAERRGIIEKQADRLAGEAGLSVRPDPALLDEVAGLVEWPAVLMGTIDAAFMEVPPEVLTTAMRAHQKYFALEDKTGKLAPRFVFVANTVIDDNNRATITAGNERVLRARLADAKFFWDQDRKVTLASRAPALSQIVFHAKLGTLDAKADRMQALAVEIAKHVPGAERDRVRSAARLAKADLTTQMVGEFPELQGVMGRYYALNDGEDPTVADAIAAHYAPQGPNDACPSAPVSVAVALADKIDTLVGFWNIDEKPTGSKDPYALRRAALGVIRLVLENGFRFPLKMIFAEAGRIHAQGSAGATPDPEPVMSDLLAFFADRLKVHLRERGVRHDLIAAVFALSHEDDLVRLLARVEALGTFLDSDDGEHLLTAYRRAANIVRIEAKKSAERYAGAADPGLFAQPEERDLYGRLGEVRMQNGEALKAERFGDAMQALSGLRQPVDRFFDAVTVNCDAPKLRENRLRLLSTIQATMNKVADFSKIEG